MKNPLAGADLYDWMALRRVSEGGVAAVGDRWLDSGHRVPGYVADASLNYLRAGWWRWPTWTPTACGDQRSPTPGRSGTRGYASNGRQP